MYFERLILVAERIGSRGSKVEAGIYEAIAINQAKDDDGQD